LFIEAGYVGDLPYIDIDVTGVAVSTTASRHVAFAIFPPYSGPGALWPVDAPRGTWVSPPAVDDLAALMRVDTVQKRVDVSDRQALINNYTYSSGVGGAVSYRHAGQLDWIDNEGHRLYVSTMQPASKYHLRGTDGPYSPLFSAITQKNKMIVEMPTNQMCIGMGIFHGHLVYLTTVIAIYYVGNAWDAPVTVRAVPVAFDSAGDLHVTGEDYLIGGFYQDRTSYGLAATRDPTYAGGSVTWESYESPVGTEWFCFSPDGSKAVRNKSFPQGTINPVLTTDEGTSVPYHRHTRTVTTHTTWHTSFKEVLRFEFDDFEQKVVGYRTITPGPAGPVVTKTNEEKNDIDETPTDNPYNTDGVSAFENNKAHVMTGPLEEVLAYDYDPSGELVTLTLVYSEKAEYSEEYVANSVYTRNIFAQQNSSGSATRNFRGSHKTALRLTRGGKVYNIVNYGVSTAEFSWATTAEVHQIGGDYDTESSVTTSTSTWTDNTLDFRRGSFDAFLIGTIPPARVGQPGAVCMDLRNGYIVTTLMPTTADEHYRGTLDRSTERLDEHGNYLDSIIPTGSGTFTSRREDTLHVCRDEGVVSIPLPRVSGFDGRPVYENTVTLPASSFPRTTVQDVVDRVAGVKLRSLGDIDSHQFANSVYASLVSDVGGYIAVNPVTGGCVFSIPSVDLTVVGSESSPQYAACQQALYFYDPNDGIGSLTEALWPAHNMKRSPDDSAQYGLVGFVEAILK